MAPADDGEGVDAMAPADDGVELPHSELVGCWRYGKAERPSEYQIQRTEDGGLRFVDQKKASVVAGVLEPAGGGWLQAELSSGDKGEKVGSIRVSFVEEDGTVVSNFKSKGKETWGKDTVAHKVARTVDPQLRLGSSGIGLLPAFVDSKAAETTARAIATFAMLHIGSDVLMQITGGRHEVFLTGVRSQAFQEFARHHSRSEEVLGFLEALKERLSDTAFANGGKASEDMVALVGASDMQVPHLDLKQGQVQVVTALTPTSPTLVYDPAARHPTVEEVFAWLGVDPKHAGATQMRYLSEGGTPLALPVAELYEHMVPACCEELRPGDAVQIRDSIVHAGPRCPDRPGALPRIVVFATYSTRSVAQYDVEFQYKIWDWASFREVPPQLAYERLLEVHSVTKERGTTVQPWVYFQGERAEACKALCTTPGLSASEAEALVQRWRLGGAARAEAVAAGDTTVASADAAAASACAGSDNAESGRDGATGVAGGSRGAEVDARAWSCAVL